MYNATQLGIDFLLGHPAYKANAIHINISIENHPSKKVRLSFETRKGSMAKSMPPHISMGATVRQLRILREIHHMNTNYPSLCANCKQGMSGRGKRRCLEPAFPPLQPLHQPEKPELTIYTCKAINIFTKLYRTIYNATLLGADFSHLQRDPARRRLFPSTINRLEESNTI